MRVVFGGEWNVYRSPPQSGHLPELVDKADSIVLAADKLGRWDSSLLAVVVRLVAQARARQCPVNCDELPTGLNRLTELALAVPPRKDAARSSKKTPLLEQIGTAALSYRDSALEGISFIGECSLAFMRLMRGKAATSSEDVWMCVQEAGVGALPIVSLISLLVGLILAFVGVIQLRMFGAEVYISSLVVLGMSRIMAAIMTGIVLAGRTGAAYAALIGSMQVNEEVDALTTLGVSPVDSLVLPRIVALTLMTPLLVVYSVFMGVLGGFMVGSVVLGIDPLEYYTFTVAAFRFSHLCVGLVHGTVFGLLIALIGCYQGLKCGRNAEAVGLATTSAVVFSIVGIIIATAVLTLTFNALHI